MRQQQRQLPPLGLAVDSIESEHDGEKAQQQPNGLYEVDM
jgi:hypothetical protein